MQSRNAKSCHDYPKQNQFISNPVKGIVNLIYCQEIRLIVGIRTLVIGTPTSVKGIGTNPVHVDLHQENTKIQSMAF